MDLARLRGYDGDGRGLAGGPGFFTMAGGVHGSDELLALTERNDAVLALALQHRPPFLVKHFGQACDTLG